MAKESMKLVANNKKAYHDYFIDEKYEAGIELHGTEVKSLRMGKCSIKESFIRIEKGEVFEKVGPNRWFCRNCGHVYIGEKAPELCPVCAHPKAFFEIEAQNY